MIWNEFSEKDSHVYQCIFLYALHWRHNGRDSVSNHQPHHCLLNSLFRCSSKKTSKLRITGLCVGNSPGTSEFPTQMASNAENVSIWWRHHGSIARNIYDYWFHYEISMCHGMILLSAVYFMLFCHHDVCARQYWSHFLALRDIINEPSIHLFFMGSLLTGTFYFIQYFQVCWVCALYPPEIIIIIPV